MTNLNKQKVAKTLRSLGFELIPIRYTFGGKVQKIGFEVLSDTKTFFRNSETGKSVLVEVEPNVIDREHLVKIYAGNKGSYWVKNSNLLSTILDNIPKENGGKF